MDNPQLETRPVAWSGNKPTKYQSIITFNFPANGRNIRLLGDPKPSEQEAEQSLREEVTLWGIAIRHFKEIL
jgi:hypothetical protein